MKHKKHLKLTAVILTVVAIISLAGCKAGFSQSASQKQARSTTPLASPAPASAAADLLSTEPAPAQQQTITLEEAKALVLQYLDLSEAKFTELDKDRDDLEYELEVIAGDTKYEVDVHMVTGTIREIDREPIRQMAPPQSPTADPKSPEAPAQQPAFLSEDRIRELVLTHFGVTQAEFLRIRKDWDDLEYEVTVTVEDTVYELELNAYTGQIHKQEIEYRPTAQTGSSFLTCEQAKDAVTAYFSGKTVRFLECEPDDGEYELEVLVDGVKYDVSLSARDGSILEIERDD